jgi:Protein of unknown function (DUF3024)
MPLMPAARCGAVLGCDHDDMTVGRTPTARRGPGTTLVRQPGPEHIRNEIRVECDIAPRHLTICECRPPRREDSGPDWTRFPITRLHYTRTTGLWTLYWPDHNLKYHRYQTT